MTWVERIGDYPVQRRESPRPGGQSYIPLSDPKSFIIHTTEGDSVDSAWTTLNSKGAAPHFIVGENRIVQCRPLSAQAATLVTDSSAGFYANALGWQVECVMKVGPLGPGNLHSMRPGTWEPLIALSRFMHQTKGVPLARPDGWHDDGSDIKTIWASNNTRRQSRKAIGFRGFLGHLDIPNQGPTWHWDPAALRYGAIFEQVEGDDMAILSESEQKQLQNFLQELLGKLDTDAAGAAGRRVGNAVLAHESPAPAESGLTVAEADAMYVKRGTTVELP